MLRGIGGFCQGEDRRFVRVYFGIGDVEDE